MSTDAVDSQRGQLHAEIEPEFCIGSGLCEALDPEHFRIDADGIARWIDTGSPPDRSVLIEAMHSCPQRAIVIKDATGAEVRS